MRGDRSLSINKIEIPASIIAFDDPRNHTRQ